MTVTILKCYADLAHMLAAYVGGNSLRAFADKVGVDHGAIYRALHGRPLPDETAEKIADFFRMQPEARAELYTHNGRARAMGHKSIAAYVGYVEQIEERLESIDRHLEKIAKLILQSKSVGDDSFKKLVQIARALIERHDVSTKS